jgi:Carboxypeptidase regulatory-like domain
MTHDSKLRGVKYCELGRSRCKTATKKPFALAFICAALLASASTVVWSADIVGTAADRSGAPISGMTISVQTRDGAPAGEAVSDAEGHYAIHNLTAGTYVLTSNGQSAVTYVGSGGVAVNWWISPNAPPIATAQAGKVSSGGALNEPIHEATEGSASK